jgi:hypothetical protein
MRPNNASEDDEVRNPEDGPTRMKSKMAAMTATDGTGGDPQVVPTTSGHEGFRPGEERAKAAKPPAPSASSEVSPMPGVPAGLKQEKGKRPPAQPAVKTASSKPPAKNPAKGRR